MVRDALRSAIETDRRCMANRQYRNRGFIDVVVSLDLFPTLFQDSGFSIQGIRKGNIRIIVRVRLYSLFLTDYLWSSRVEW